jgi:Coenzyme PQQ synthesis protein D (PqqD)
MPEPRFLFRQEHLAWRVLEDEAVVLDLRTKRIYFLNRSGAALWNRLGAGASLDDLAVELAASCGRDPLKLARDVSAFISDLNRAGLIRHMDHDLSASRVQTPETPQTPQTLEYDAPQITQQDLAFFAGLGCGKSSPTTFECTRALRDS